MLDHYSASPLRSALHMERYSEMHVWQHCLRLWSVCDEMPSHKGTEGCYRGFEMQVLTKKGIPKYELESNLELERCFESGLIQLWML